MSRPPPGSVVAPATVGLVVTGLVGMAIGLSPVPWTLMADTGAGFLGQTWPAYRRWASGSIPEWSDLLWGGVPLLGDCSNATLYPPHLLAYFATIDAPLRFFDVALALHLGLLAAGSVRLLQRLDVSTPAAVLGGLLAILCPMTHFSALVYFPAFASQAWWPWGLVAAESLSRPSTPLAGRAMVLGWIALAAQIYAGMPEQAAFGAALASAWLLTRRNGLTVGQRVLRLTLLGVGAVACAAPQLLPTLAFLPTTGRAEPTLGADVVSLHLSSVTQLFGAGATRDTDTPTFFGLAATVLVTVAVVVRRPRAAFLLIAAILSFLLATGREAGLYPWLHMLPPFDHFRTPLKLQVVAELAVAWGAALALDPLWRSTALVRVVAVVLAGTALVERGAFVARREVDFYTRMRASNAIDPGILAALRGSLPARAARPNGPPPPVLDLSGPTGGGYARSLGALVGMSSLRAYPMALLDRSHQLLLGHVLRNPMLASVLGVHFALVDAPRCERTSRSFGWPIVERHEDFCILRNRAKPPHYMLLGASVAVDSVEAMVDRLRASPQEPIPVVGAGGATAEGQWSRIVIYGYSPGRATLGSVSREPQLLLVRESFSPGWDVRVDDRRVPIYPAAGIYFVVALPAGIHRIELRYRTPGFRTGLALFAAWIAMACAVTIPRRALSSR